MEKYIGTKIIQAEPQARKVPTENPLIDRGFELGYKVIYEDGCESWSPKDVFEKAYKQTSGMNFGLALEALKAGEKVARAGWNGKGMWLCLIPAGNAMFKGFNMQNCIGMKTANDVMQPGWLASQVDMLSNDWQIVD